MFGCVRVREGIYIPNLVICLTSNSQWKSNEFPNLLKEMSVVRLLYGWPNFAVLSCWWKVLPSRYLSLRWSLQGVSFTDDPSLLPPYKLMSRAMCYLPYSFFTPWLLMLKSPSSSPLPLYLILSFPSLFAYRNMFCTIFSITCKDMWQLSSYIVIFTLITDT